MLDITALKCPSASFILPQTHLDVEDGSARGEGN